jgi:alkaline phosphatase D
VKSRLDLSAARRESRRRFLAVASALASSPFWGYPVYGQAKRDPKLPGEPFTLGVASGEPSFDGFVIWTRLAPEPITGGGLPAEAYEVDYEVAQDEGFEKIVRKGTAIASPHLGHSVHVEVEGLAPGRPYFYRFRVGDHESPVGHTKTAPALDATPDKLRFAFASCQHWESGYFTAFEHMAKEDLDLVIHLGDYIYEYAGKDGLVRKHVGKEIESLDDYRNRLAQYKTDRHLQETHRLFPWLVTWDDHEFDNDYATLISEEQGIDPNHFYDRRANSYQAYYEHMPLRRQQSPSGAFLRLYRRAPWGRLAEFAVLDTRQYRTDQPGGGRNQVPPPEATSPQSSMLGAEQERWLDRTLAASGGIWNVLAQQVMIGRIDRKIGEEFAYSMDQWPGYELPRRKLLQGLADANISNPVVLTGDIHSNWVNDLALDWEGGSAKVVATEFVGTSITSGGNGKRLAEQEAAHMTENPFLHFYSAERGYVSCTVTPTEWKSDYQAVEFVDKPGAPLITRASFVVEAGEAGAKEA